MRSRRQDLSGSAMGCGGGPLPEGLGAGSLRHGRFGRRVDAPQLRDARQEHKGE